MANYLRANRSNRVAVDSAGKVEGAISDDSSMRFVRHILWKVGVSQNGQLLSESGFVFVRWRVSLDPVVDCPGKSRDLFVDRFADSDERDQLGVNGSYEVRGSIYLRYDIVQKCL